MFTNKWAISAIIRSGFWREPDYFRLLSNYHLNKGIIWSVERCSEKIGSLKDALQKAVRTVMRYNFRRRAILVKKLCERSF